MLLFPVERFTMRFTMYTFYQVTDAIRLFLYSGNGVPYADPCTLCCMLVVFTVSSDV